MAYATVQDVMSRTTRSFTQDETNVIEALLEDAAVLIDAYKSGGDCSAGEEKKVVSCRMVLRALGSDNDIPMGATQGSMSGLGYSQSWTIGTGGSVGELYLSKTDKRLLGGGNKIGSHSPVEDLTCAALQ